MGAQPLRIVHGLSNGARHLTDPQAIAQAKDLFVKSGHKCSTIGNEVGRSRDMIEMWASQGNWVELRKQFEKEQRALMRKRFGSPDGRAARLYQLCDKATSLLLAYTDGKQSAPPNEVKDLMQAVSTITNVTTTLNRQTGLNECLDHAEELGARVETLVTDAE